jgi:hypothetical protein
MASQFNGLAQVYEGCFALRFRRCLRCRVSCPWSAPLTAYVSWIRGAAPVATAVGLPSTGRWSPASPTVSACPHAGLARGRGPAGLHMRFPMYEVRITTRRPSAPTPEGRRPRAVRAVTRRTRRLSEAAEVVVFCRRRLVVPRPAIVEAVGEVHAARLAIPRLAERSGFLLRTRGSGLRHTSAWPASTGGGCLLLFWAGACGAAPTPGTCALTEVLGKERSSARAHLEWRIASAHLPRSALTSN